MSPEQATGTPTDHRTDVFSFGCVLYETLTGGRAFDGETASDALASVMTADPDLRRLPRGIHPKIGELIRRCLEKDLRSRWQAIGDVRIEIETLQEDPRGLLVASDQVKPGALRRSAVPVLATVMGVGVIVAAVMVRPKPVAPDSITRFSIDVPAGFRLTERGHHAIAVSADGSRLAFVANDQLNIRDMPDPEVHAVSARIFGLNTPLFSPDGRSVAFFADGKLYKVPVTGGTPLEICETPNPFGASWGQDNAILIGGGPNGIQRVSGDGGELETIATVNPGEVAHGPQMLPDGEHVLFTLATDDVGSDRWDRAEVVVQSLKSRQRKVVVHNGSDARYDPSTGNLVYADGLALRVVPFDVHKLQTAGEPESIAEGLRRATLDGPTGAAQFGMSATGTLAYVRGGVPPPSYRSLVQIDMNGATTVLDTSRGQNFTPRFSADGQGIAWQGGDGHIWILDRSGIAAKRQLTWDGKNAAPVWTRDGRIVFQSSRGGERGLYWQRADGSDPSRASTENRPGICRYPDLGIAGWQDPPVPENRGAVALDTGEHAPTRRSVDVAAGGNPDAAGSDREAKR